MISIFAASIFLAIANIINNYTIPSEGVISLVSHPSGKLHIGNEANGEKPWFFYDENGHLVTLRVFQSGERDSTWYTDTCTYGDFSGEKWCEASIKFAKDAEMNCFRIHMFFGDEYMQPKDWLFPTRRTTNNARMNQFVEHLEDLANNDIYFVLDGYLHAARDDYWLWKEVNGSSPSFGGLFWNTTVRDDFIWIWNETLTCIKNRGANVWNHLVFIEPWSEWFLNYNPNDPTTASKDPYRYNQSDLEDKGFGNASLVSWQNWLEQKYNGNITALKDIWDNGGGSEYWNFSGVETDSFKSLIMPVKTFYYSYNRAYDFSCWYSECIVNFTRDCNQYWKTYFPDLYVAWDGWQSFVAFGARLTPSEIQCRYPVCYEYSDVLDGHEFFTTSDDFNHWAGDRPAYQQLQLATVARTLKKPYITGEFGATMSIAAGYADYNDPDVMGCWNVTLSKAIRYGYAGWCPYWISYWHAFETGIYSTRVARADARRPYMRQLNLLYKAAENWMDKIEFDPIMLSVTADDLYGTGDDHLFNIKLFDQAGYVPKYWRYVYDNETIYPSQIPADVEVLIVHARTGDGLFTRKELQQAADWLNADTSHKIVLIGGRPPLTDLLRSETFHYENFFNTSLFPLSPVTYGNTYTYQGNSTDVHVSVDGTSVLLKRSQTSSSGYIRFSSAAITGTCLINYTDGEYPNQPMTIINDRVAWIGSDITLQCGNPAADKYSACTNGYLIIRKVLSYWGYKPKADITQSYWRVGYVFSKLGSTYGIQGFYSLNETNYGTITPKFNFTRMGLNKDHSYVVFSTRTKTAVTKTPAELENGISVFLGALDRENLILRSNDSLRYLYSDSFIFEETLTSSLTCRFVGVINQTDTAYFYFPYDISSEWKIELSNGTTLNAEDYYDNATKIIKIPFKFKYPSIVIRIYNISASMKMINTEVKSSQLFILFATTSISSLNFLRKLRLVNLSKKTQK
jgi:hypothetical protein